MRRYLLLIVLLATVLLLSDSSTSRPVSADPHAATATATAVLEDFDDAVTRLDLGFNDFAGNMGAINDHYLAQAGLHCPDPTACSLRLDWDFGSGGERFTGYFFSLFGLTDTLATFDGSTVATVAFPEHVLDLDNIDGALLDANGTRAFTDICLTGTYSGAESLQLRLELADAGGGMRFQRHTLTAVSAPQTFCWDFRHAYTAGTPDLNLGQAKLFTIIIEQRNIGAGINNPLTGRLDIDRIWFRLAASESAPVGDQELLDLMEKRAYQYFVDWSSRKPDSRDIPQDRSTFGDLLTVGGVGFAVPAHVIGAERGWTTRADAAGRVLNVLTLLDNPTAFGPEPVGRIGYRGWFYHFLGVDGRRKLNFDFPATADVDESLNTVELSSIDTGLALMGILAAQTYFDHPTDPTETQIRNRAQSIYDRVEWDYLLEPDLQQFYLGWKPDELYEGPAFDIPARDGHGFYSGHPGDPATLDYYTDEALILILLGVGSETHPVPPELYQQIILDRDDAGLIRTYPGALFTYQFLHAFFDTRYLTVCHPVWYNNSRHAIWSAIAYATQNPNGRATYGPTAWGISANEGPFDAYGANGAPPIAVNPVPEEDGSVTYYAMLSAAGYGADLRQEAIKALRAGWERGHWHPRFGLPDAFHADISELSAPDAALRQSGPWHGRALFAIDQGPMLLHLENARSGLIWRLLAANPNIVRSLERLETPVPLRVVMQGESGVGQGQVQPRSNAWEERTIWLRAGESRTLDFFKLSGVQANTLVRYSNDSAGPGETVTVSLDGIAIGTFVAEDTGDGGHGWNVFLMSPALPTPDLTYGQHTLTLSVAGGDGYGVEIDAVAVDYFAAPEHCTYSPIVLGT